MLNYCTFKKCRNVKQSEKKIPKVLFLGHVQRQIWFFITVSMTPTADGMELPEELENPSAGG